MELKNLPLVFTPWSCVNSGESFEIDHNKWDSDIVPGVVAKDSDGNLFLIGDVNCLGGTCDDCVGLYRRDVVAIAHIQQLFEKYCWPLVSQK